MRFYHISLPLTPGIVQNSIVLGELYFGVRKSGRVKQNLNFIAMYQLIEPKGKLRKKQCGDREGAGSGGLFCSRRLL